jgi:flagellar protein FliO/FliZ
MSVSASRAQALAAALPAPALPSSQVDVAASVSPATAGLEAAATATAPADAAASKTEAVARPQSAAQAFAQAPANTAQDAAAKTAAPAVAGRPGTVATVGKPVLPVKSPATAGSIGGAVAALVLVVGLILALGWLAKRLPGLRGGGHAGNALRVVGSLSLSPRERVVVVAVGETQLLLGVGTGGIRALHTLEQPLPVAVPAATPAFAQLLAQHFGKKA